MSERRETLVQTGSVATKPPPKRTAFGIAGVP